MANRVIITEYTQDDILNQIRFITGKLLPDYNFEDENDIGRYLIDIAAAMSESNNVFANDVAIEGRSIFDARDPKTIPILAGNNGYRVRTAQPCKVLIRIDLSSLPPSNISISAYSFLIANKDTSDNKKYFENTQVISLFTSAGSYSNTYLVGSTLITIDDDTIVSIPGNYKTTSGKYFIIAEFVEGRTEVTSYDSDGVDFQRYVIPRDNLIIDTIPGTLLDNGVHVQVNGAINCALVNSFLYKKPTDYIFTIRKSILGNWYINFSNGVKGFKPDAGQSIDISYRYGGGLFIAPAFTVSEIVNLDSTPRPYVSKITNELPSFDGKNQEDAEYTRYAAPLLGGEDKTLDDADKIESFANSLNGVERTKVDNIYTKILLAVIPYGGAVPSTDLLTLVNDSVKARLPFGYSIETNAPIYVGITIDITLKTKPPNTNVSVTNDAIAVINNRLDPLAKNSLGKWLNLFNKKLEISDIGYELKKVNKAWDFEITAMYRTGNPAALLDITFTSSEIISATLSTLNITTVGGL